ncbi:2-aminoethylphosphonate ABC transporter substrate-binding protein [Manganibacter manganicus]|uniref:2-aminoethylphosphonate ABC transporter substrate-binding protein n=1 Tax=Manganibacter manganicus TaxID=1873176 RepID=A0A1V8RWW4_9HYPH|nr:2-aminoethylphosphonate ABC transporter substrate-binding protein [Pseudaminobacter manganicus]OQM77624.1 2-aminoethylphosphonate ABC transporter substrate-binding protein [Pseudaminobacter manganicus]
MKAKIMLTAALLLATTAMPATAEGIVTIYSADGLHSGDPSWLGKQFEAFTKATGIEVQYVEAGSSGVVDRVAKEKSNTQADVIVTLPPFIQKAAAEGLLEPYTPADADKIDAANKDPNGLFTAMINNYPNFIYNSAILKEAPKTYDDLLDPKFKQKIQYSTPGQAGDGTALMLQTFHAFGSKDAGLAYLKKLQVNNLGPSASTGKLTALVNKGELYVANGDMQMNLAQSEANPNIKIFFPTGPDGKKTAFSMPYYIGLVAGGPDQENGKKLIDFLLSEAAQKDVASVAQGFPVRSDIHPDDENFKKLNSLLEGVEIWQPDWDKVLTDLKADVAAYNQAISSN